MDANEIKAARYLSPAWIAILSPTAIRAFLSGVAPKATEPITVIVEASERETLVARPRLDF